MKRTPLGQEWLVRYHDKDGNNGLALTEHYSKLPCMIEFLIGDGARNIVIFDKTFYKDEENGCDEI